jgi:hypothetical protein
MSASRKWSLFFWFSDEKILQAILVFPSSAVMTCIRLEDCKTIGSHYRKFGLQTSNVNHRERRYVFASPVPKNTIPWPPQDISCGDFCHTSQNLDVKKNIRWNFLVN